MIWPNSHEKWLLEGLLLYNLLFRIIDSSDLHLKVLLPAEKGKMFKAQLHCPSEVFSTGNTVYPSVLSLSNLKLYVHIT